ncbi:MAG: DUF2200 family protein [Bacteroidota bacterium]
MVSLAFYLWLRRVLSKCPATRKSTRITNVIFGQSAEDIENPLTQKFRYLAKLVDELTKARRWAKCCAGLGNVRG